MLAKNQNEQLAKDFDLCSLPVEEADVYNFVSDLADMFMGAAQYNSEIRPNISYICRAMTNKSHSAYDNLRRLTGVGVVAYWSLLSCEHFYPHDILKISQNLLF